jgi:glycerol transport system ATP-binding protein
MVTTAALPAVVTMVQDVGTYWLVTAKAGEAVLRARLSPDTVPPRVGDTAWLSVLGPHTCFYNQQEELIA